MSERSSQPESNGPLRILHVSSGLRTGGAETMLLRLLEKGDRDRFAPTVVSLAEKGAVGQRIEDMGVPVRAMNMHRAVPGPAGLATLVALMRDLRPHVVQTWMYHADLIGGLAARMAGGLPVCWGVHHTEIDRSAIKRSTYLVARACAQVSGWLPSMILCCSESSLEVHAAFGYPAASMRVVANGFDLDVFRPQPEERRSVREELDIEASAPVVGLVARFDPQKDHQTFLRAAARLVSVRPTTRFVLCGEGVTEENEQLMDWLTELGLRDACRLLGRRTDVPRLLQAFDLSGTSSSSEALPLVVGEAMAAGVPCVVTDVGDSARLVGDTGRVVPSARPDLLAEAWRELIDLDEAARRRLGEAARARIRSRYDLRGTVERYQACHAEAAGFGRAPGTGSP